MFEHKKLWNQRCILAVLLAVDVAGHMHFLILRNKIFDMVVVVFKPEVFLLKIIADGIRELRRRMPFESTLIPGLHIVKYKIKGGAGTASSNVYITVSIPYSLGTERQVKNSLLLFFFFLTGLGMGRHGNNHHYTNREEFIF